MPYKTIIIELLRQHPRLHAKLRRKRKLLTVVNQYARELKTRHEYWKANLSKRQPGIDPNQVASAAMEIALAEVRAPLRRGLLLDDQAPPSSDTAGAQSRNHTSLA